MRHENKTVQSSTDDLMMAMSKVHGVKDCKVDGRCCAFVCIKKEKGGLLAHSLCGCQHF